MSRQTTARGNLLFDTSVTRRRDDSAPTRGQTLNDINSTSLISTGSFRLDAPGSALKSTQQLNVDFSKFQNHTFFGSGQAKVQKAFARIINGYPFDGTKFEIETFLDSLTGFEKYVFDIFPKNVGYLNFSGSSGNTVTDGTYMIVTDFKGSFSTDMSNSPTGEAVLDFGMNPFTVEFFINIPSGSINENSIILQKINGTDGMTLVLSNSSDANSPLGDAPLLMMLSSGSLSLTSSMTIPKGTFQHCAFVMDRNMGAGQIKAYQNGVLSTTSSFGYFGQFDFRIAPMTIGSGTNAMAGDYEFKVESTLSGAMDELRFWHKSKSQKEIFSEQFGNVFADKQLKLLYRFNEPSGSFAGNGANIVLDSSGNSLHSRISNFSMNMRSTSTLGIPPLLSENPQNFPILFPSFKTVIDLNSSLLSSGSDYDFNNPNLVTKLIPPHYLQEAQLAEGFSTEDGDIGNELGVNSDQPGGAKVGQAQIITSLLYMMSETFDELKMFVDEFKRLLTVDYVSQDTISDHLIPWLSNYYGIALPSNFATANLSQLKDGSNVTMSRNPTTSLQVVQNTLWRRIFADLPKNLASRGTMESLKASLRNMGINSDGPVRIRELGGAKTLVLGDSFAKRHEIASMMDFSGSLAGGSSFIQGGYLSGSRIEPGIPNIAGTIVSGTSNQASDGLFTSGSWTFEGTYKFRNALSHPSQQSLIRIVTTGSDSPANTGCVLFNLIALAPDIDNSVTGSLQLWACPNSGTNVPALTMNLQNVDIFDGEKWQVTFGRSRNDEIQSYVSASYFMRASKFTVGGLEQFVTTSSYFDENTMASINDNLLQNVSSKMNTSGSFMVIGDKAITTGISCLNRSGVSSVARTTKFTGKVAGIRFWSKALTELESKMHARNFKSLGVEDPTSNFNFVTHSSGSFQRLRTDVSTDQIVTGTNGSGAISLMDFSQNGLGFTGAGFGNNLQIINPERFDFEVLSSDFKSENPNKIRIRSFSDPQLAELNDAAVSPAYTLNQYEQPKDDKRVQIEISAVQALNEDIMNIFATLDSLDNAIGSPELVFSQDYPVLRDLRRIYFNRLTGKVNFVQLFQFFKWFDETVGDYLSQMLPYDSRFMGSSFVIEPHALERPKFIYNYYDMYLGEEDRGGKELLLLQQFVANMRKF